MSELFRFLLARKHQARVQTALITATIAITLIPKIASRFRLTEPLLFFEVGEDLLVADPEGVKTAALLAKHELATALAETVGVEGLMVAFPAKSHDWGFLLVISKNWLMT